MALEFKKLSPPAAAPAALVVAEERLWLNADRDKLVAEDDEEAAFLFCSPGDEIPVEEAKRYGLLKQRRKPRDKQAKKAEDK